MSCVRRRPPRRRKTAISTAFPQAVGERAGRAGRARNAHGKYYLEDDFALSSSRGSLAVACAVAAVVRLGEPHQPRRARPMDAGAGPDRSPSATGFSLTEADGIGFPAEAVRNDLREAYVTWEPLTATYLESGRINLQERHRAGLQPDRFLQDAHRGQPGFGSIPPPSARTGSAR